eukprot:TRINITY_DN7893_c0_g2_i4.p1 TRINITY_DN7893_c0_g2~~TRINITY_DN7893_c0_g2_i4.p1  ORF type:complete len:133 (+),score=21.35 TRINITY_DN7893_c0_g2_i4:242-640(+)
MNMTGGWCGTGAMALNISKEPVQGHDSGDLSHGAGELLVLRPAAAGSTRYPFVMQWIGGPDFRLVMGPELWLPRTWDGCSARGEGGELLNVCPVSCMRTMARGSGDLVKVAWDPESSAMMMTTQDGQVCYKN